MLIELAAFQCPPILGTLADWQLSTPKALPCGLLTSCVFYPCDPSIFLMAPQLTPRLSDKPTRFPNRIREYRLRGGLTQKALGVLIHKSRKLISAWERGQQFPAGPVVFRLAKALNTLTESLYEQIYSSQEAEGEEKAE
jgi:DNA-binding XRE family transcriptional regulator